MCVCVVSDWPKRLLCASLSKWLWYVSVWEWSGIVAEGVLAAKSCYCVCVCLGGWGWGRRQNIEGSFTSAEI